MEREWNPSGNELGAFAICDVSVTAGGTLIEIRHHLAQLGLEGAWRHHKCSGELLRELEI